jgi:hypothetical protein
VALSAFGELYVSGSVDTIFQRFPLVRLLDGGTSEQDLVGLALNFKLGANATPPNIVDLLYTNVMGFAPSAAAHDSFTSLLTSGALTSASLGVIAAESTFNTVKFVGVGAYFYN